MAGNHGGRRVGAGRKPSTVTLLARESLDLAKAVGCDPLAVVLAAAADEQQSITVRLQAAAIALPYLRPRLAASLAARVDLGSVGAAARPMPQLAERFRRLAEIARADDETMAAQLEATARRFAEAEPGAEATAPAQLEHAPEAQAMAAPR